MRACLAALVTIAACASPPHAAEPASSAGTARVQEREEADAPPTHTSPAPEPEPPPAAPELEGETDSEPSPSPPLPSPIPEPWFLNPPSREAAGGGATSGAALVFLAEDSVSRLCACRSVACWDAVNEDARTGAPAVTADQRAQLRDLAVRASECRATVARQQGLSD
jgi:hypothetical protein